MQETNLEYLKNSLKYLGFGDNLNKELEQAMREGTDKFKLMMTGEFVKGDQQTGEKQNVSFSLDFSKSSSTDMYFLNKYDAVLRNEDPAKDVKQTFYNDKGHGITAKEAYNLLNGRAVNKNMVTKDDQKYNTWIQLDFKTKDKNDNYEQKRFGQNYGYSLEETLKKYPIKELTLEDDRLKLLKSLEKGNLVPVTFSREGKDDKMFISANPQFKTLNLYNSKLEYQYQGVEKNKDQQKQPEPSGKSQAEEKSAAKKESVKNSSDEDGPAGRTRKKSRGARV